MTSITADMKPNPAMLLSPTGQGGNFNPVALLQTIDQLIAALKKLQSGQANTDGFSAAPGGAGRPVSAGVPSNAGATDPLRQLSELIKTLTALQGKPSGPGAGGQPGASSPLQGQGGPALPLGDAASLLQNLKKQEGAMLGKIAEGVSNGTITRKELAPLMRDMQQLANNIRSASSDGQITQKESCDLSTQSLKVAGNVKMAVENGSKDSFAPINPRAQLQARQVGAMSQGVQQGSINNANLSTFAGGQAAIADASSNARSLLDKAKVLASQLMEGAALKAANMGPLKV